LLVFFDDELTTLRNKIDRFICNVKKILNRLYGWMKIGNIFCLEISGGGGYAPPWICQGGRTSPAPPVSAPVLFHIYDSENMEYLLWTFIDHFTVAPIRQRNYSKDMVGNFSALSPTTENVKQRYMTYKLWWYKITSSLHLRQRMYREDIWSIYYDGT